MKPQRFQFYIREIGSSKIVDGKVTTTFYIEGPEVGQKEMRFDTVNLADKWLHETLRNLK